MKAVIGFILIIMTSCAKQQQDVSIVTDISESAINEISVLVIKPQFDEPEPSYSNFSFIQANNSGLYVTPSSSYGGAVLNRYAVDSINDTVRVEMHISEGRGPGELEQILMSSKSVDGDTLYFTSPGKKMLGIDADGKVFDFKYDVSRIVNFGFSFSYLDGNLLIPSLSRVQTNSVFKIYNLKQDTIITAFPTRVPFGFEPSIRNEVLGETPVPGGFAISFLGDRKVYILNTDGIVVNELILGESDEIQKSSKVLNPQDAPKAKPYITKHEFYKDHLIVLMESVLWVIDYSDFSVKNKIRFTNQNNHDLPVLDFSISDDYLFTRIGREGVFISNVNEDWF